MKITKWFRNIWNFVFKKEEQRIEPVPEHKEVKEEVELIATPYFGFNTKYITPVDSAINKKETQK